MTESFAGWHPDPTGRHEHRYFDGADWTEHVADKGNLSTDSLEKPPESAPAGPSMINLPAITPAALAGAAAASSTPDPTPAPSPTPAATQPAPASTDLPGGDSGDSALERHGEEALDRLAGLGSRTQWRLVTGGGALLFVALLLPWYKLEFSAFGVTQSDSFNAYSSFSFIDMVCLVASIFAIVIGLVNLGVIKWRPPAAAVQALPGLAVLTLALIIFRVIVDPVPEPDIPDLPNVPGVDSNVDTSVGRGIGLWLGLLSALALTAGSLGAMRSSQRD